MHIAKLFAAFVALATLAGPACAQSSVGRDDPDIGVYQFSGGRQAYVEYLPDIQGMAMVEFPSGRVRPLQPTAPHAYSFGPSIGAAAPVVASISIDSDHLRWTEDRRTENAARIALRAEDVSFRNGDVTLAGTLTLPPGRGPFPAVVMLHGGGAQDRTFFLMKNFWVARGIAVLAYDKRGVGGSTGDWRFASFRDLASDALAGVDLLRTRADIRRDRIGLFGSSNGGWTAPLAASMAPDKVAFLVTRSASGQPERANIVYEAEGDLRGHGFGDAEVAQLRALHQLAGDAHDEASYEAFRTAIAGSRTAPWFELSRLPPELPAWQSHEAQAQEFIEAQHRNDYDVLAVWSSLRMPVFAQNGGSDRYVPGPTSVDRIRAALAGNRDAEVRLYPSGDHPMFDNPSGYERDIPQVTRYTPGYLTDLDAFLRRMARQR